MSMYDLEAIRKKMQAAAGNRTDPDEFRPAKCESQSEPLKYYFYVLGPLQAGSICKSGKATADMDNFYVEHGMHWVNNKPYACPRACNNEQCKICTFGFDLMREEKDQDKRQGISKTWMPQQNYTVNIYFPEVKANPEPVRGRVMYYKAPKTCFDIWQPCIFRDPPNPDEPDSQEADELGVVAKKEAYGIFYDENAAFLFCLEALKNGKNNAYKSSHFIVPKDGRPQPIRRTKEGGADTEAIKAILNMRIDLFTKLEKPDPDVVDKQFNILSNGGDGGFDSSEQSNGNGAAKTSQQAGNLAKQTKAAVSVVMQEDNDLIPDPDLSSLDNEVPLKTTTKAAVIETTAVVTEAKKVETAKTEAAPTTKPVASDIADLLASLDEE